MTFVHLQIAQSRHLNFIVEMADVADDGHVLHAAHVVDGDDILIAGGGDKNIGPFERRPRCVLHRKPSMAAWRAQIGSTSVTTTTAPEPRSDWAEPFPTSP